MRVLMSHQGHLGYGADQIENPITLGELLEAVQDAVSDWGEDAEVVVQETNNGHGANYGRLYRQMDLFSLAEEDEDE